MWGEGGGGGGGGGEEEGGEYLGSPVCPTWPSHLAYISTALSEALKNEFFFLYLTIKIKHNQTTPGKKNTIYFMFPAG